MNCKEKQLVRYVGTNSSNRPNVYGWVGTTVEYLPDDKQNAGWIVDPPLPGGDILDRRNRFVALANWVADAALRPIDAGESPEESTEAMRKLHEVPQEVTT